MTAFPLPRMLTQLTLREGGSEVYTTATGSVVKVNCDNEPYCVPNEYVCGSIANLLGLPVPSFSLSFSEKLANRPLFITLNFGFSDADLPPLSAPAKCFATFPALVAGIIVFDCYVANSDRHKYNLAVDYENRDLNGQRLPLLSIFDHGSALLGRQKDDCLNRLTSVENSLAINNHCLKNEVDNADLILPWLTRIQELPDFFLDDICKRVVGYGVTAEEAAEMANFLKRRKGLLRGLMGQNIREFPSLPQLSVFMI